MKLSRLGALLPAAILALGGCTTPPSPTPSALPTTEPTPTVPATRTPPVRTPRPTPTAEPAFEHLDLELVTIDPQFTFPHLEYTTDGTALLWSSAAPNHAAQTAANLWRYVPGEAEPEAIFINPDPSVEVLLIGGDGAGAYAFMEVIPPDDDWRLWYLPEAHAQPILIDEADVEDGWWPFFAMDSERLIWSVFHQTPEGVNSQLLMATLPEAETTILRSVHADDQAILYPSLDGDRLVFTTTTVTGDDGRDYEVALMDLTTPDAEPRVVGEHPAWRGVIRGDLVVWSVPHYPEWHPDNGGPLMRHDLRTGRTEPLGIPSEWNVGPSIGNRWLTSDPRLGRMQVYVYDLHSDRVYLADDLGDPNWVWPPPSEEDFRPYIAGDLLIFVRSNTEQEPETFLMYAQLPP